MAYYAFQRKLEFNGISLRKGEERKSFLFCKLLQRKQTLGKETSSCPSYSNWNYLMISVHTVIKGTRNFASISFNSAITIPNSSSTGTSTLSGRSPLEHRVIIIVVIYI